MSNTEWTTFVDTFKALKDTNDGRSTFEQFVDIHRLNRLEAHNTAQFLVWHRYVDANSLSPLGALKVKDKLRMLTRIFFSFFFVNVVDVL